MSGSSPIIGFIQSASAFLTAGIADERGFIQLRAVVTARGKIITMGVTVIAEFAHSFADGCIGSANVLFLTVFEQSAFIFWFIEATMFLN